MEAFVKFWISGIVAMLVFVIPLKLFPSLEESDVIGYILTPPYFMAWAGLYFLLDKLFPDS